MTDALNFVWDGQARAMRVTPDAARRAAAQFVHGYTYSLATSDDRTPEDHRHLFGMIRLAWENLPHELADEFPDPEMLRKRALVRTGFYNEARIHHDDEAAACKTAALAAQVDGFAVVGRHGHLVVVRTPKSMAEGVMKRAEWRAAKDAVLAFVSNLIGVDVTTLQRQAEAA